MRFEVRNAIHFEPQNLLTFPMVLARIELGTKISWILDGYWSRDERGHVVRVAPLTGSMVPVKEHLDVSIDLRPMKFSEVYDLYKILTDLRIVHYDLMLPL